jgi:hypothetical protein
VVTLAGQDAYGAGHVDCWFLQTRGTTDVSHVEPCAVQLTQVVPPEPHEPFVKPGTQPFTASQQPGHVPGVQGGGGGSQRPPRHTSPSAEQSVHWAPFAPHWVVVGLWMQTSPRQQPAQFCGPHAPLLQMPPWHVRPCAAQFEQNVPPNPHALSLKPCAHALPRQHPGQFIGLQSICPEQTPPLHVAFGPHGRHCWPKMPHAF